MHILSKEATNNIKHTTVHQKNLNNKGLNKLAIFILTSHYLTTKLNKIMNILLNILDPFIDLPL